MRIIWKTVLLIPRSLIELFRPLPPYYYDGFENRERRAIRIPAGQDGDPRRR